MVLRVRELIDRVVRRRGHGRQQVAALMGDAMVVRIMLGRSAFQWGVSSGRRIQPRQVCAIGSCYLASAG